MLWILYLALVAATALGNEMRESKDFDPLRYNPHEQIYKYEGSKREQEVLDEFNSPDYSQQTLVLDYRYMKTGGREYIQGPGGQYIILPHHVKSPQRTKFKNFDELLDHLQHRQHNRVHSHRENYDDYHHDNRRQHKIHHQPDDDHHNDRHLDDRHHTDHHHTDRHHTDRHHDEHRYDDHYYREHEIHRDHEN